MDLSFLVRRDIRIGFPSHPVSHVRVARQVKIFHKNIVIVIQFQGDLVRRDLEVRFFQFSQDIMLELDLLVPHLIARHGHHLLIEPLSAPNLQTLASLDDSYKLRDVSSIMPSTTCNFFV